MITAFTHLKCKIESIVSLYLSRFLLCNHCVTLSKYSVLCGHPAKTKHNNPRLFAVKPVPQLLGTQKAQALLQNGTIAALPQRVQSSAAAQPDSGGEPFLF